MSGGQGSKWSNIRNFQTALRSFNDVRDEGQTRGWERQRKDNPPPASDPPLPTRPAYGYQQQYTSDPGPHSGFAPWHSSPPPPPQGQPSSLPNQNYQGHYQGGSSLQGYGPPPAPNVYHSTHTQAYGQNQGYIHPAPPAPYPQYHPAYPQQPNFSADQNYHGGQGSYPYPHNQTTYQPAGNSYAPHPLPPRHGSQDTQAPSQSSNVAGSSHPGQSGGGSLSRTVTAPPDLPCEHVYPGNVSCRDCGRIYGFRSGR